MLAWIITYVLISLFCWWVVSYGGAQRLEGWLAFFVLGWFALDWRSEQIRLFVWVSWIMVTLIFVVGIFKPEVRVLLWGYEHG